MRALTRSVAPLWRHIDTPVATVGDPNSLLASAATQDRFGTWGITTQLNLGTAYPDPGAVAWWIVPLVDDNGYQIDASKDFFAARVQVVEETAPTHANDMYAVAGICSETDLNNGTVDAAFGGLFSDAAGGWEMRAGDIVDGAVGNTDDAQTGSPVAADIGIVSLAKAAAFQARIIAYGLDSSDNLVSGAAAIHTPAPIPQFNGPLYAFYAAGVGGTGGVGTDTMTMIPRYRAWVIR